MLCCAWSMYAGMTKHQHTALQQENNWLVLGYVKTCDIARYTWYIQVYTMYEQSEHKSKMCIQFFQIWREHDVVCMWAVCVNVQTLENHPEMQNLIACIYMYMHSISRHALSQTCIYMYMHGISHSGRGSGFQMRKQRPRAGPCRRGRLTGPWRGR